MWLQLLWCLLIAGVNAGIGSVFGGYTMEEVSDPDPSYPEVAEPPPSYDDDVVDPPYTTSSSSGPEPTEEKYADDDEEILDPLWFDSEEEEYGEDEDDEEFWNPSPWNPSPLTLNPFWPPVLDSEEEEYGEDEDVRYPRRFLGQPNRWLFGNQQDLLSQAVRIIEFFGLSAVIGTPQPSLVPGTTVTLSQKVNPQNFVETVVNPNEVEQQVMKNVEPCKKGAGICTDAKSCNQKDEWGGYGTSIGRCSNCFGCKVCCKFQQPCQSQTDQLISYFTSPGYPKTQRRSSSCSLNVKIRSEVCQVRLDFLDFEMAAPLNCACRQEDNMEIINPHQQAGIIGPGNNKICGINKNKHMYLDVNPDTLLILKTTTSGVRPVPLAKTTDLSGDTAYRWNVRVTQIPCEEVYAEKILNIGGLSSTSLSFNTTIPMFYKQLRAPAGCLQYYRKRKGSFESFSFDGDSRLLSNTDYAICMKNKRKQCGMTLRARTFSIPAAKSKKCESGEFAVEKGKMCCERSATDRNYLAVPAADLKKPNKYRELFCGKKFGKTNDVVSKYKGPLFVRVKTSDQCPKPDKLSGKLTGFRMDYEINTGTC